MSGGGGSQTITERADPWRAAQPGLRKVLRGSTSLFNSGGFTPEVYGGDRVAGFGDASTAGQDAMLAQAGAPNATSSAQGYLSNMMDQGYQSDQLEAVKRNALGSAIPAATSMFSGSGMTNSSQAMEGVGRAAMDAVAPYEYGAYENAAARGLSAAGMAPQIDAASYLPSQMMMGVGSAQDAMRQAGIDADMARFYEGANPEMRNLQGYLSNLLPISGQGGTATSSQPGPSTMQNIAAGGLTGIGTYGALAGAGVANPYLLPLSIGAGLAGML